MPAHHASTGNDALGPRAILAGIAITLVLTVLGGLVVVRTLNPPGAVAVVGGFRVTTALIVLAFEMVLCWRVWQLVVGDLEWLGDVQALAAAAATMTFITLVLDNWLAASIGPSDPRVVADGLRDVTHLHTLFALAPAVVIAFVVGRYGVQVRIDAALGEAVAFTEAVAAVGVAVMTLLVLS